MNLASGFVMALWIGAVVAGGPRLAMASPVLALTDDRAAGDPRDSIAGLAVENVSALPPHLDGTPQLGKDFSGRWALNVKASDNAKEKVKAAIDAVRPARSGGRRMDGGMGGKGRGGGMGGGGRGHGSPERMRELGVMPSPEVSELIANAKILDITHQEPMLVITDENERRQRLVTNSHALGISGSGPMQQRVTIASWEGGALVVDTTMNTGARLAQKYQIEQKTGRLVVVSVISFPEMKPVSYRLVYDRVMSGNGQPKEPEGG